MYQAWPWGGTSVTTGSPSTGFVQPVAAGQVAAATQWPAGYNQYTSAAMTPEMQQQWATWAAQAQYAYAGAVPGQVGATTAANLTGVYSEYQPGKESLTQALGGASSDNPKTTSEEVRYIFDLSN